MAIGSVLAMTAIVTGAFGCGRWRFDPVPAGDAAGDGGGDGKSTAKWTLGQVQGFTAAQVGISPSQAGDLIVAIMKIQLGQPLSNVIDDAPGGSSTYVPIPGAVALSLEIGDHIEVWYTSAAHAGAIHVMAVGTSIYSTVIWEVSGLATNSVESSAVSNDLASSTLLVGPTLTPGVGGEFVVSVAINGGNVIGMHAGNEFARDVAVIGNGWAHLPAALATAAPHHAEWDTSAAAYCSTAVAFGP